MSNINSLASVTLLSLDKALKSLGEANASDTMEDARFHIGVAIVVMDYALSYAESAMLPVVDRVTLN